MAENWVRLHNEEVAPWLDKPSMGACPGCGRYPRRRELVYGSDFCWHCLHGEDFPEGETQPAPTLHHAIRHAIAVSYYSIALRRYRSRAAEMLGRDAERQLWQAYLETRATDGPDRAERVAEMLWPFQLHEDEMTALKARMEG